MEDDVSPECFAVIKLLDESQGLPILSLESDDVDALMSIVCLHYLTLAKMSFLFPVALHVSCTYFLLPSVPVYNKYSN